MKPLSKKSSDRVNANKSKSDDGDCEMETSNFDLKSTSQSLDVVDGGGSSPGCGTGSGQSDVEAARCSSFNLGDLSKALDTVAETRLRARLRTRYEVMKGRHEAMRAIRARRMMRFREERVLDGLADKDVQQAMRTVMQVLEDDGGRGIPLISVYRVPRCYCPKKDHDMRPPPPPPPPPPSSTSS